MLTNVDYKKLLQTDKCVYTGNMNGHPSTEEHGLLKTYETLGKYKFYYSSER